MSGRAIIVALVAAGCTAAPARAQTSTPVPGRFEVAVGATWFGGARYGSAPADETAPSGDPYQLFTTSSRLGARAGAEARIGVRLFRGLQVEAHASYARPQLRTAVSADVEDGSAVTAVETVEQFTVGGDVIAHLTRLRIGARAVPFLEAGVGYLRQLHERQTLVATGRTYSAGGGIRLLLRSRPAARLKALGVRADVNAVARTKGVALDGRTHVSPVLGVSLFARF